jgi:DUF971 family protein
MAKACKPLALRREGEGLLIEWDDGTRGYIPFAKLRQACPCASCAEERAKPPNPFRILSSRELAQTEPIRPKAMVPRGFYAYQIVWNDGHDTGIYTLEQLYQLGEKRDDPDCQPDNTDRAATRETG